MRETQGSFLSGYVRVQVEGMSSENFFQACIDNNILVWNIKKESDMRCSGNISLKNVRLVKQINRSFKFKIKFTEKRGLPFLFNEFFAKKELIISLLLSVLLILFLSNIIWKIEISGVPKELDEQINKQLAEYGIHPGAWTFTLDSPGNIQNKLESDIPDLLWVGVHKKGTTYALEGVEKIVVEKKKVKGPRDLVATKKGIIKKMYVSKGRPLVSIHDYVEPGDVLVKGNLVDETEQKEKDKTKNKPILVASEGKVIANTWYEVAVTIPLTTKKEKLTGNMKKRYYLKINNINIPIWGFRSPDYNDSIVENKLNPIRFLKWELPIHVMESSIYEKSNINTTRNEREAIGVGIEQARSELQLQLGPNAVIKSEKILHEDVENGKVRLKLYLSVEENIVEEEPIVEEK